MSAKSLEQQVERLQAYVECQNLMGRYEYWHVAGKNKERHDMFAKNAPGIRVEYGNFGVYDGVEAVKRFMFDFHEVYSPGSRAPGKLSLHALTTPVIEVAGDAKTARGVWISPGYYVIEEDGKKHGGSSLEEYAVDFIKEDGVWKFWRIRLYITFVARWDQNWADFGDHPELVISFTPEKLPDNLRANKPRSAYVDKPFSKTGTCHMTEFIPPVPEPYETWDESMACVPKPK